MFEFGGGSRGNAPEGHSLALAPHPRRSFGNDAQRLVTVLLYANEDLSFTHKGIYDGGPVCRSRSMPSVWKEGGDMTVPYGLLSCQIAQRLNTGVIQLVKISVITDALVLAVSMNPGGVYSQEMVEQPAVLNLHSYRCAYCGANWKPGHIANVTCLKTELEDWCVWTGSWFGTRYPTVTRQNSRIRTFDCCPR